MANALLLGQAANLGDAQGVGVLNGAMAQGQDMAAQRQQMGQRNALFQQQQEDRQRQMQMQQQEQQNAQAREALAGYFMTPPERRGQYYQSVASKFGLPPDADHAQVVGGVIQSNPGILGPELSAKILEREFAPKPQGLTNVAPGGVVFDQDSRQPVYTAPRGPSAADTRLVPVADPSSTTGFVYAPSSEAAGQAAPAPRQGAGRLPASAQKMEQEDIEAIQLASAIERDLAAVKAKIEGGKLPLGVASNMTSRAKNFAGLSDEGSRNFASFKSTLEKLRNDSLRLNKGVQTEGDAVRAWDELFASINDPDLVKQRLDEIGGINARAIEFKDAAIQNRRANFGAGELDTMQFRATSSPLSAGPAASANPPGIKEGATATNPKTGQKIQFRGGQWVPM